MRMLVRPLCVSLAITLAMFNICPADVIIEIPDALLFANTPNQQLAIYVSGNEFVQGVNFNLQIAPNPLSFSPAPRITALDIVSAGMVFGNNNTGQTGTTIGEVDPLNFPGYQFALGSTTTASDFVLANGLLGTITLDTTGLGEGIYTIEMFNTLNGPTDFTIVKVSSFQVGSLTILAVPEPSALSLILLGLLGNTCLLRRKNCRNTLLSRSERGRYEH